uniref:Uncharacterized protein n=1 Tax=Strigamia maritima TaxID=126957 RepID=T1JEZ2_STRMM
MDQKDVEDDVAKSPPKTPTPADKITPPGTPLRMPKVPGTPYRVRMTPGTPFRGKMPLTSFGKASVPYILPTLLRRDPDVTPATSLARVDDDVPSVQVAVAAVSDVAGAGAAGEGGALPPAMDSKAGAEGAAEGGDAGKEPTIGQTSGSIRCECKECKCCVDCPGGTKEKADAAHACTRKLEEDEKCDCCMACRCEVNQEKYAGAAAGATILRDLPVVIGPDPVVVV